MIELLLLAVAAGATAAEAPLPELVFEAPPELAGVASRLERLGLGPLEDIVRLTGAGRPGPPIRVVLAPEASEAARRAPPWVSGYAFGAQGVVVLLPERIPAYPHTSLEDVLWHELAHVLVARAARGHPVPRWFDEGVAMVAGRSWGLQDHTRLLWQSVAADPIPLYEVERLFGGDRAEAQRAYALAGAFVRDLLHREGREVVAAILAWTAVGVPFEEAFYRVTAASLAQAESDFWSRQRRWERWLLFLTSSAVLWMAVTALALWAAKRRRDKTARLRERWEAEEAALEPVEPAPAPRPREWIN